MSEKFMRGDSESSEPTTPKVSNPAHPKPKSTHPPSKPSHGHKPKPPSSKKFNENQYHEKPHAPMPHPHPPTEKAKPQQYTLELTGVAPEANFADISTFFGKEEPISISKSEVGQWTLTFSTKNQLRSALKKKGAIRGAGFSAFSKDEPERKPRPASEKRVKNEPKNTEVSEYKMKAPLKQKAPAEDHPPLEKPAQNHQNAKKVYVLAEPNPEPPQKHPENPQNSKIQHENKPKPNKKAPKKHEPLAEVEYVKKEEPATKKNESEYRPKEAKKEEKEKRKEPLQPWKKPLVYVMAQTEQPPT